MQPQAQTRTITESAFVDLMEKVGPKAWPEIQVILKKRRYSGGDVQTERDVKALVEDGLLTCYPQPMTKKRRKALEQLHGGSGAKSLNRVLYAAVPREK
ncbi:hypothetical protein HN958_00605 [Candidatus Falkowbacteria bacterium]|jgi:hypothetical protein|nr:hypothetical protein [Candidatus Falkowbacteria bacterium]MBT7006990.1 hypothetical protein [Candidatus Falkowbacteria bacterium]